MFAPLLASLVEAYPDDLQVVYRHFPLTIHQHAQLSAEASEAAGTQGAFWPYHDLLYETQSQWSGLDDAGALDFFVDLAGQLDLDTDQFRQELENDVYAAYVEAMFQEGVNLQLPGTPAAVVDGFPVTNIPGEQVWRQYIDEQIVLQDLEARQYGAPPEMMIDTDVSYSAVVTMENGDAFTIELLPQSAPQTVNSFVFLAEEGWFDGVPFHRVLPGFVAQTGDPTGTGRGGPGYTIPNEIDEALSHNEAGVVAMANSGPDTNGSQWYVTLADNDPALLDLDGSYTIFGRIAAGLDVVQAITPRDPQDPAAPPGDRIATVTIVAE